jgi:hypothetical protein
MPEMRFQVFERLQVHPSPGHTVDRSKRLEIIPPGDSFNGQIDIRFIREIPAHQRAKDDNPFCAKPADEQVHNPLEIGLGLPRLRVRPEFCGFF